MKMLKFAIVALTLASIASPSFAADKNSGSDEARRACTPDVFRLCSEFIPNADKITACLKAKHSQLSPACKAVFGK